MSRSTPPTETASPRWRRRWDRRQTCRSSYRPRRRCSARRSRALPAPGSPVRACDWRSRSRSVTTSRRAVRSTTRSPPPFPSRGPSASTIILARRRCRTCWRCASAISCSSRCGTPPASTMSRSPCRRPSGSKDAAIITTAWARSGTWCRTTCCSSSRSSRWSHRRGSTRRASATRRSRCCARSARSMPRASRRAASPANTAPARPGASRSRVTPTSSARRRPPRRSSH